MWKIIYLFLGCMPLFAIQAEENSLLKQLLDGNERYVSEKLLHPNRSTMHREELVSKQAPFGTILSCSDSRVPPEIIFDQGIGDLFIVRVAGNVLGATELDSIEYSVAYLGSQIIFVLGHENCGAVSATKQGQTKDIEAVANLIQPALATLNKEADLEQAIKANVLHQIDEIKKSEVIQKYIREKKLEVYGGYYELASGKVVLVR